MLRLEGVRFERGGKTVLAVDALQVAPGGRLAVLGPSGSGKTTLLRLIAGLERPQQGRIVFAEIQACKDGFLPPCERGLALLSQDLGLWPHLNAAQHIAFVRSLGKTVKAAPADWDALDRVGLKGKAFSLPGQLSGGEQQRLALARALAMNPRLLLLDEPFANIDWVLRDEMLGLIEAECATRRSACILVTHSLDEAVRLADRAIVLMEGRIIQTGGWDDLAADPATDWIFKLMEKLKPCTDVHSPV